ncbi:MAG: ABC transporter permease subunit [Treponema sp.]|jgi:multiple sugar transport system permease protein/putative aldouronate transport system permease protein|nr:ABC transporter permease subunit [Treponema sp.]
MARLSNETGARPLVHRITLWQRILNARYLYILLFVPFVYVFVFNYIPIYGILMAFKRFAPRQGVWGSPWVGMYNFQRFFSSPNFLNIIKNTLVLSLYGLIAGFPFPLLLAICVNHSLLRRFTKFTQSVTFAPYFLSAVLLVTLLTQFLGMRSGGVNMILSALGLPQVNFMGSAPIFPHIYVWSGIWQGTGYSAIIYISSLAAVDPTMHEAGIIDGATIWQRIWHIDLPTIRPIIVIMLILSMGGILAGNFEKTYVMQNPLNIATAEIIPTYVYKVGLGTGAGGLGGRPDYSFGTAIGLFQNLVGVILTLLVNKVANLLTGEGMF